MSSRELHSAFLCNFTNCANPGYFCHKTSLMSSNSYSLKNEGLFQPKFGSYMDKPNSWVKNVFKKKMYS